MKRISWPPLLVRETEDEPAAEEAAPGAAPEEAPYEEPAYEEVVPEEVTEELSAEYTMEELATEEASEPTTENNPPATKYPSPKEDHLIEEPAVNEKAHREPSYDTWGPKVRMRVPPSHLRLAPPHPKRMFRSGWLEGDALLQYDIPEAVCPISKVLCSECEVMFRRHSVLINRAEKD